MKRLHNTKKYMKYVFAAATAAVLLLSSFITAGLTELLDWLGMLGDENPDTSWALTAIITAVACAIIGGLLSLLTNRYLLRHVNTMFDGMEKLASGKYDTRIDLGNIKAMQIVSDSFNSLAEELENTEILRSDFINNFSHEFKTPMVSIKGLISLLKSGRVSEEKKQEYLAIIEEEIDRLTMMTTNILNLSKIESQGIVSERARFNLSEQIRTCILLEHKKWSEKKINLSLEFDEFYVEASEDLLKQVWLNLIDNAIKFSNRCGKIKITIEKSDLMLSVSIANSGDPITEEDRIKIWNKFYQTEKKHSKSGNGIGLSIVKSIVEMHAGNVSVRSEDGMNIFTVSLPFGAT